MQWELVGLKVLIDDGPVTWRLFTQFFKSSVLLYLELHPIERFYLVIKLRASLQETLSTFLSLVYLRSRKWLEYVY